MVVASSSRLTYKIHRNADSMESAFFFDSVATWSVEGGLCVLLLDGLQSFRDGFVVWQFARFTFALKSNLEFVQFGSNGDFSCLRKFVGKQDAVEVIDFVLDGTSEESVERRLEQLAVQVVGLDVNGVWTLYRAVDPGHAKATFLFLIHALGFADDRIDEDVFFAFFRVGGKVDDENPQWQVNLIGCKADSSRLVHQRKHLPDDRPQLFIHSHHGL